MSVGNLIILIEILAACLFCCILVRGVEKFLIGIIRENFRKVVWCCWMGNIPIAMERKRIVGGNLSGCIIWTDRRVLLQTIFIKRNRFAESTGGEGTAFF